jgi:FkbM family methyltransferase
MNATLTYDGRQATFCDCNQADCIEEYLLRGHWYELPLLEFIRKLQVGGNYADAGAYVGTFSLFASLFCPAETVHAFEPQADIYAKLVENIRVNGAEKCQPHNVALSDREGMGAMTPSDKSNRGGSLLNPGTEVQVVTLDSRHLSDVRLIKIDVENSELAVLQGARQTLANGVEHLFIETWPEETCKCYGVPFHGDKISELLHGLGFLHQPEILTPDTHWWRRA